MKKNQKLKALKNYPDEDGEALKKIFRMVRFTVFCFFLGLIQVLAVDSYSQMTRLSLHFNNERLENVLGKIEDESEFFFLYNRDLVDVEQKVNIRVENETIKSILDNLLKGTDISYVVSDRQIILSSKDMILKMTDQQKTVSGKVTDTRNQPLPGVTVVVKGTTQGTVTNAEGEYSLSNIPANATLQFSFVGMKTQEFAVGMQTTINVVMTEESLGLEEVVVAALGIKREEKSLGYVVQKVVGNSLQTVKGIDMTQSLTGKVAGLTIKNTTEFNGTSGIEMRGESPLLVIDGVPYGNIAIRDIPADEVADITVLKGATASALYGARGSSGAMMITTKKGSKKGFAIDINSNSMFRAGWTALPKAQTSYGHGLNGEIADDYVWGPKLDIGKTAIQWNPVTKQNEEMPLISSGKNNFRNFLQPGIITNNNVNITQTGENGYFRTSFNHVYNKGQYPNQTLNKFNYTLSGEINLGDKISIESQMGLMRSTAPQVWGGGYGNQGYIYQLLMWSGPDYDLRQYRDYWVIPNEKQNWLYNAWYDNPYMIANEKLYGVEENKINASLTMNIKIAKDLKLIFRNGYDYYKNEDKLRNPAGIYSNRGPSVSGYLWDWSGKGMYGVNQRWGNSLNSDLILTYKKSLGKLDFDVLGGGSIYYYQNKFQGARTANGLAVPGWYSLVNALPSTAAGVNSIQNIAGTSTRQVNSFYGKLSLGWNNMAFLDVTGRNDWSSTQPKEDMSYFYPSVAGSVVLSEMLNSPEWLNLWKIRGSWTIAKSPLGVYANNRPYSTTNSWGNISTSFPGNLQGTDLLPSETRTWEIGTAAYFFIKRLYVDFAYFDKLYYNRQINQSIASSSGFASTLINTKETYARRGFEVTLSGSIVKNKDFEWNSTINYATQHRYYVEIDPVYSQKDQWTKPGKRLDYYAQTEKVLRDPKGNMIHSADGNVWLSNYKQLYGYKDPNFTFGFINNFTWKDWTAGIGIDGRIGGLMDNYIYGKMFDTGSAPETDTQDRYDEVVNGKQYIGKGVKVVSGSVKYDTDGNITEDTRQYAPNDIPVSYQEYMRLLGNSWEGRIHKQSFIKLREVSVTYSLPYSLISKTFISNASVAITGQNLYLWTKDFKYSDPDVGSEDMNAPSQRMIGVNVKIGF